MTLRQCDKCGRILEDDENECPACGAVAFDAATGMIGLWG